jgi:hypothetical protein
MTLSINVQQVFPKKYISSSDESIENLLYYKDCQHKPKTSTEAALRSEIQPTPVARQPDCPFPKMCCSMSCGNDCGNPQSYLSRQMEPIQNFDAMPPIQSPPRQPRLPVQPQLLQRARKKKLKLPPPKNQQTPFGGRRDSGFTKERIKSLISQDTDIRKILKDLVRVTMQKVDLLEIVKNRKTMRSEDASANSEEIQ